MPSARAVAAAILLLIAALPIPAAAGELYLIVHASNPVKALSQREAVDLYMGRTRSFPGGAFALPLDLPRDSAARAAFYRSLTDMEPAQINSYWARLVFTGQTMPPQPLPSESAVIDVVRQNPGALGYVSQPPADRAVRVVLVLKTPG